MDRYDFIIKEQGQECIQALKLMSILWKKIQFPIKEKAIAK